MLVQRFIDSFTNFNVKDIGALIVSPASWGCIPKWRKFVIAKPKARGSPDGLWLALALPATEPPYGLPRRYAPRNDELGVERIGFPSLSRPSDIVCGLRGDCPWLAVPLRGLRCIIFNILNPIPEKAKERHA
jgi:hypothetical protein